VVFVDFQPTSENLLLDFAVRIKQLLPPGITLHHLILRETASSFAEWFAEDQEG
jgi:6-pyruvoyltetrahydropterin/6-carboxytetrahydropterin synthase